jgi:uncharacterized protein YndB with AHSA1/START domain
MGIEISRLHVRRSGFIEATPQCVWQEFMSFERVEAWFGTGHKLERFEPQLGGEMELSIESESGTERYGGPILVFDEARELSFENNWKSERAWVVPTFVTIRLTPLYDGTLVELFHHGFERLGTQAASQLEGYEEGWATRHLVALREIVER